MWNECTQCLAKCWAQWIPADMFSHAWKRLKSQTQEKAWFVHPEGCPSLRVPITTFDFSKKPSMTAQHCEGRSEEIGWGGILTGNEAQCCPQHEDQRGQREYWLLPAYRSLPLWFCVPLDWELLQDRGSVASATPCLSKCLFQWHKNIHPLFSEHPLSAGLVSLPWSLPSRRSLLSKELID